VADLEICGWLLIDRIIIGFAFVPVNDISPNASRIISDAKELYKKKMETSQPWLKDQYATHLNRLERGGPGCEFISFPGLMSQPNPPQPGKRYFTLVVGMNHQWSRGTIHSTSNDPSQEPEFDPHDFEEDIDMQMMIESLRFVRKLANTAPLKDILVSEINPGVDVTSDRELREWVHKYYNTTFHTAGSCSMLPRERGGVVDTNLKVYGSENIRVVDLSVLPILIAAHTQSTVYAIAEHGAEAILKDQRA